MVFVAGEYVDWFQAIWRQGAALALGREELCFIHVDRYVEYVGEQGDDVVLLCQVGNRAAVCADIVGEGLGVQGLCCGTAVVCGGVDEEAFRHFGQQLV